MWEVESKAILYNSIKNSFRLRSCGFGVCYCLGEASFRLRKIHLETLRVRSEVHRGFLVFVSIQLLTENWETLGRNASIFTVQMVWGMSCISEMGEKHCPALGPELHFHVCRVKVSSLAGHG